ncbi:MAG: hypothetical protein IT168_19685 [Bryobacterales bacterium]|nr:hypothetical protein [Bryobacterales bacterium]
MLDIESRMEILGVTVFRDTDRKSQFFYLPGPPHITQESGSPLFDLFLFRKGGAAADAVSGGFLNMTVDTGLGGMKDRVEAKLKEQFGDDINLASVPLSKGQVRVIALGEDSKALTGGVENERTPQGQAVVQKGPRFIENILGATTPSLDAQNRAIFSFSLNENGAAFFMGALTQNVTARPIGVIYELEYIGLLPAYDLEVTINFKQAYEYMRTRFTLGTLFFRADIDNIVEQLKRNESIKIREVARTLELSTPEAVQARQQRIDQLVKDLAAGAMFHPSLTPGEPRVSGDTITAADPTNTAPTSTPGTTSSAMDAVRHGPSAAINAGMGEALLPRTADANAQQGQGQGQPQGQGAGSGTPAGNGGTPAGGQGGTGTAGTTGATDPATNTQGGNRETAADVWNRLGRPQAAFALKQVRQEEERTVTYNLTQVTAQKQTIAPQSFIQLMYSPADLRRRISLVDLNHPFFQRININVSAGDVDFAAEGIKQMTVQLRYGVRPDGTSPKDTAEVILRARTDTKDFTFFADANQKQSFEYKLIVDYQSNFGIGVDDVRVEGPWIGTEARSLAVHPRSLGRTLPVTVQLAPNVSDDVASVQSKVRYFNQARQIDKSKLVTLDKNKRSELVNIRLADAKETFEVSSTIFFSDGAKETLPTIHLPDPTTGTSDDVVVIGVPPGNLLTGDIIMQDPLVELSSVLVDTQVNQGAALVQSKTFELQQSGARQVFSVRLPQRDKPARLSYRERRIFKDGGIEAEEFRDAVTSNLIVGVPAQDVVTVNVRYLGPQLSSLGINAMMLDFEYTAKNKDPKFDQSTSLLITDDPTSLIHDWKIRLPDRREKTYRWRMKMFFNNGSESGTEFRDDTRTMLILRPPQA